MNDAAYAVWADRPARFALEAPPRESGLDGARPR
jgi:hypothetical protein